MSVLLSVCLAVCLSIRLFVWLFIFLLITSLAGNVGWIGLSEFAWFACAACVPGCFMVSLWVGAPTDYKQTHEIECKRGTLLFCKLSLLCSFDQFDLGLVSQALDVDMEQKSLTTRSRDFTKASLTWLDSAWLGFSGLLDATGYHPFCTFPGHGTIFFWTNHSKASWQGQRLSKPKLFLQNFSRKAMQCRFGNKMVGCIRSRLYSVNRVSHFGLNSKAYHAEALCSVVAYSRLLAPHMRSSYLRYNTWLMQKKATPKHAPTHTHTTTNHVLRFIFHVILWFSMYFSLLCLSSKSQGPQSGRSLLSKVPLPRPDQVAERVVYVERTQIPHKAYWCRFAYFSVWFDRLAEIRFQKTVGDWNAFMNHQFCVCACGVSCLSLSLPPFDCFVSRATVIRRFRSLPREPFRRWPSRPKRQWTLSILKLCSLAFSRRMSSGTSSLLHFTTLHYNNYNAKRC